MTAARLALVLVMATATSAAADIRVSWLDFGRRVPRTWSASRDAPTFALGIYPRDVRTAGGELALATIRTGATALRLGFAGLLELESDGETTGIRNGFPHAQGSILWRGAYAFYAALSLDAAGDRLCDGCVLEVAGQYRHESQHYTGSNEGDDGMDVSSEPYVGNEVIVDAAVIVPRGRWLLAARALGFAFLPDQSSYAGGPGLDLHLRWRLRYVQPFVSGYAEYLFGSTIEGHRFDDAYLLRALAGVALPSRVGDVMVYVSADVGNRKGIRGLTEEATLGFGIRLAFGPATR